MAKSIMIQGTMSNAGKSVLVGGLCRVFSQDGYKVAPFKSQNMALNSFITKEGLEMGRAQVMQAEAAGIEPAAEMNPILLKPTNDTGSQVIVNGEVAGVMSAAEYYKKKREYVPAIMEAYRKLEERYEIIVIEGAGSPAEINLKENDIVNMGLAKMVDAPVLLVGDIGRGGVFAQMVGTLELLEEEERKRVKGMIINKFRGDKDILEPGLHMLSKRTGIPVCGVVPYFYLNIDDEDSLTERFGKKKGTGRVDIVVIRLPRISNFTDFAPLEGMEDVSLRYVGSAGEFGDPDAVILPGTKNTIGDLLWLRQNGLEAKILRHSARGKLLFGICGGYQMLGEVIEDPKGMEQQGNIRGMGLLPMKTVFVPEKTRTRVRGHFQKVRGLLHELEQVEIEGYEIHMGISRRQDMIPEEDQAYYREGLDESNGEGLLVLTDDAAWGERKDDGMCSDHVYGCYVHGIFDRAKVVEVIVRALLRQKGYADEHVEAVDMSEYKEEQYDKLAQIIRENIDMETVYRIHGDGKEFVMFYLITGGSGSGKSEYAEDLLCDLCKDQTEQLVYIATMFPSGHETEEKIRRHQQMRRDKGFQTIECYTDLNGVIEELKKYNTVSVLIECISNLVSNELFFPDTCYEDHTHRQTDDRMNIQRNVWIEDQTKQRGRVVNKILTGAEAVRQAAVNVVVVTNEVNSEGIEYSPEMIGYKQVMGEVNCRLAEMADEVREIVYGIALEVKSRL